MTTPPSSPTPTPPDPSQIPGTPEYRNRLRDQTEQVNTEDIGATEQWQPGDEAVTGMTRGQAQTPTKFPTGEDTELNTRDE